MKKHRLLVLVTAFAVCLLAMGVETAAATDSSPATQAVGQAAESGQAALATSGAAQVNPTNQNVSVRIFSPGDNGSVSQSNTASSGASAGNVNLTGQSANQGGSATPMANGQPVASEQIGSALGLAGQAGAANTAAPAEKKADGGSTSQANGATSGAGAGNANATGQSASQAGGGGCGCDSGSGTQAVGQSASNHQAAAAKSSAVQEGAKNSNVSVRIFSPGDNGNVEQSNNVSSEAKAGNLNGTAQSADQSGGGGSGTQAIGQSAKNAQLAGAASEAVQHGAKNENVSVRIKSKGNDGDVSQSNNASSNAAAGNLNLTGQNASQGSSGSSCGCGGSGTQAVGQEAKSAQLAGAASEAIQTGASNTNVPVRIFSHGGGGSVEQSNNVSSEAKSGNLNLTHQSAEQTQDGGGCCGGGGTQAVGQSADSAQASLALSKAIQAGGRDKCGCSGGPSNSNTPVRIDSWGHDGDVSQSNNVSSHAAAGNLNATKQSAGQGGSSGSGTQAIGQDAKSAQLAAAASIAAQLGAENTNAPVRISSGGGGGSVEQSNNVESGAHAGNANLTYQGAEQGQRGGECCGGTAVQAVGQQAENKQAALAFSAALQAGGHDRCGCSGGPSNSNTPVRIDSWGHDGDVSQSNNASSYANAGNLNGTLQYVGQAQGGGGGTAVQAVGQSASSFQLAAAASLAAQLGATNTNAPTLISSGGGGGGSVEQSNNVGSAAHAGNANLTGQIVQQRQAGSGCGCYGGPQVQAIGQESKSAQIALGLSAALQLGAGNHSTPAAIDSKAHGDSKRYANDDHYGAGPYIGTRVQD